MIIIFKEELTGSLFTRGIRPTETYTSVGVHTHTYIHQNCLRYCHLRGIGYVYRFFFIFDFVHTRKICYYAVTYMPESCVIYIYPT